MMLRNVSLIAFASALACVASVAAWTQVKPAKIKRQGAIPVKVVGNPGSYTLYRGGNPYFIRGVGGNGSTDLLVQLGGNSIRTWGAENLGDTLDYAHQNGLTVTAGIWLGHTGDFNYSDPAQVKAQFEMCRGVVERYKDHPALLMWAFGNEMEGNGKDRKVWEAVEAIAAMSKSLDPNHPTMTVIAEIGDDKVKSIQDICKSIDIIGVNSYGGAPTLASRFAKQGGRKPYILTEFGPLGQWEVPKTRWEAPIEATSTEKADFYRKSYEAAVSGAKGTCLGSYAFLWGNKQEATATWFGMLLPDGKHVGAVDVLAEKWTGKPRKNLVPRIVQYSTVQTDKLRPGQVIQAIVQTKDPEGKPLRVQWLLQGETVERLTAGRDEKAPPTYHGAILQSDKNAATVKMPTKGGGYRLFVYVYDDAGGAAVANIPLYVEAPIEKPNAIKADLPLVVYDESKDSLPFAPTGYRGNIGALELNFDCKSNVHTGKHCLEVRFSQASGWAGVAFQFPANDRGQAPEAIDLSGAKSLTWWMRGARGGEKVKIEFGILKADKPFPDSASASQDFILNREWKRYEVNLASKDLSRMKTGFVLVVAAEGSPVQFFLDEIRYE